ncbi:hypothetical protein WDJ51_06380 [Rathayibacter sp. YIM 133350]|uniref:hypothetical protein n=1 Tax=Rathayibacter sp. YIM 133350 TaxID=3131992 RepID=UPI00307E7D90
MHTAVLLAARTRARWPLAVALALVCLLAALALTLVANALHTTEAMGVRSLVAGAQGESAVLRVSVNRTGDADDDAAAERAVRATVRQVVQHGEVARTDTEDAAVWVITAPAPATADGARALSGELGRLPESLEAATSSGATASISGGLLSTLDSAVRGSLALASVAPIPLLFVGVFTALAVAEIARLLGLARSGEVRLLAARGLSPAQRRALAVVEGAILALPTAAIGFLAGGAYLPALPLVAGVVLIALVALPLAVAGDARAPRFRGAASGTLIALAAVATIGAVVTTAQLLQYGTTLVPDAAGVVHVDGLAVLAPVLALLAAALLLCLAARPIALVVERMAASRRGLGFALAARHLARESAVYQLAVVAVSLAVGATVFASGYASSWADRASASAQQSNGAEVRVRLGEESPASAALASARSEPGVGEAAPVASAELRISSDPASLIAIDADRMAVLDTVGGTVDTAGIGATLTGEVPGQPLGPDATEFTVGLHSSATEPRGTLLVSAWIMDDDGALARLPLGTAAVGADATLSAALPSNGEQRLLAVDAELTEGAGQADVAVALTRIAGSEDLAVPEQGMTVSSLEPVDRLMATPGDAVPVPAVVSRALADRLGLARGDRVDVQFDGVVRATTILVAGVTPTVPGAETDLAVIASLPTLDDALLRTNETAAPTNEVWASAVHPVTVAKRLQHAIGGGALATAAVPSRATRIAAPAVGILWTGVGTAAAFALAAVAAIAVAMAARRRSEVAVLRAVGVRPMAQAGARAAELGGALGGAVIAGALVGGTAVVLTVPSLVGAAVVDPAPSLAVTFDVGTLGVLVGVIVLAVAALVLSTALTVRAQAQHAQPEAPE